MTRPSIVRADTIDLQDRAAPSAKDHQPIYITTNLAPHQAETLREVAEEAAEEQARSPRLLNGKGNGGGAIDLQQHAENISAGSTNGNGTMQLEQEDSLAVAQNGGISSSDEGDLDGDDGDYDDDMADRISSSPSIDDEDIDFNFVYALHTFVATVQGQANATKGDTMALLDDTNSYWWLVRVIKDSSIGYLPAEHIETPTERLARLNKHRNVDLSASMLGDQAAKQKNTFKSIRKRRKTVTFADPTYVDYQDPDFSTDEEDIEELFGKQPVTAQEKVEQQREEEERQKQQKQQESQKAENQRNKEDEMAKDKPVQEEPKKIAQPSAEEERIDETAKVQPLKTRIKEIKTVESVKEETPEELQEDANKMNEAEQLLDVKSEGLRKTRNGTLRNTDSFFKDETAETKKITLTPKMLRDDNAPRPSNESLTKDLRSRTSLDKLEKDLMSDKDRKKSKEKDKREKDKKPGGLRGFFSRGSRKKASEDEEDYGKRSMEASSDQRASEDTLGADQSGSDRSPAAQKGKLQKAQPRTEPSPTRKPSLNQSAPKSFVDYGRTNDVSTVPPASMRIVDPDTKEVQEVPSSRQFSRDQGQERSSSAASRRDDKPTGHVPAPRSASAGPDYRAPRAVAARSRMQLDDSDNEIIEEVEEEEEEERKERERKQEELAASRAAVSQKSSVEEKPTSLRPQLPGAYPDSYQTTSTMSSDKTVTAPVAQNERLSESPVHVSPISTSNPPPLMGDTSSQEGRSLEDSPSPELVQADDSSKDSLSVGSSKEANWDDSKLRQFFEEGEHIRDLLLVVYDRTNVEPAGQDHPVVGGLFREQNAKLAEITTQLDNMLGDWLARKQRLRGTV
ncbi:hypothetical protein S7711_08787 [Stachybotrys chartarum IBT 7711]|uniref:SH3 domain-containing protein n=1 Tax=Stachybotrys chartarum (strain CBS 109288 / IBT 7711) TaxID=1280523 RepID=A0A084AJX0_STACB|nr:hypothetical protein S7711_08787 [Stachybotrys chartarum IBT 7711]